MRLSSVHIVMMLLNVRKDYNILEQDIYREYIQPDEGP